MSIFRASIFLALILGNPCISFGQPKGVPLRNQNLVFIFEDEGSIFNLIKTSIKPYKDSGQIFNFDLQREYKVVDKSHPEDIGLNEYYMVWCDKDRISSPMVRHLKADGMPGMIDPPNFGAALTSPGAGTYQRKVLDYVCNSQLGQKYKINSVATQPQQVPLTTPVKPSPPAAANVSPSSGAPIQTDIGKLVVVYQPDADAYYPSFSKRSGEQGEVVVRLIIGEGGNVEEIALLKSSKFPRLDRAASEIGRRYHFKPFLVNGSPTRVSTNLLIKFNIKEDDPKGVKPKFEKNPLTSGG